MSPSDPAPGHGHMSNICTLAIPYPQAMSLRRLRYFTTVADEGSSTAAARTLHMAQPPLSNQVRRLEQEMGVDLFDRTRRQIALTAAGQALLPEARKLLEQYRQLAQIAQRAGRGETGRLAIGIIPSAANGNLPIALRRFRQRFPDVEISLIEDRPDDLLRRLDAGRVDLVLHYSPPGHPTTTAGFSPRNDCSSPYPSDTPSPPEPRSRSKPSRTSP